MGIKKQSVRLATDLKRDDMVQLVCDDDVLAEAVVTRIDNVEIHATEMFLNGRRLYASLASRDADMTDNEFAEADGFESFMDMTEFPGERHPLPMTGKVVYWRLV